MKHIEAEEERKNNNEYTHWSDVVVLFCVELGRERKRAIERERQRIKFSMCKRCVCVCARWSDQIESNLSVILWYLRRYTHKFANIIAAAAASAAAIVITVVVFRSVSFGNSPLIVWFVCSLHFHSIGNTSLFLFKSLFKNVNFIMRAYVYVCSLSLFDFFTLESYSFDCKCISWNEWKHLIHFTETRCNPHTHIHIRTQLGIINSELRRKSQKIARIPKKHTHSQGTHVQRTRTFAGAFTWSAF